MVAWFIVHLTDMLLWLIMAVSVVYVLFFALASLLPRKQTSQTSNLKPQNSNLNTFLVLYPAYHEDRVIRTSVETFLRQDYPADHYQLVVISDHQTDETNAWLAQQPITLLIPQFVKSSKAKALQYAMNEVQSSNLKSQSSNLISHVVILDADNVVASDFLSRLNAECQKGYQAIQCHRTAKNADSDIAALDGLSEEINNSIFRRGHNRVGLSSALIGSGMCIDYDWFASHVDRLSTAGEDKELEAMLLWERVHIHYAEDILVKDEKVSGGDNFQRQRLRWMTAQAQCLMAMLPRLPQAIGTLRIDYIDKTFQQALIPRSMLLVAITVMALVTTILSSLTSHLSLQTSVKWWVLLFLLAIAILIAIPHRLRTRAIFVKALALPSLVLRMIRNLLHIKRNNTEFLHTTHGE